MIDCCFTQAKNIVLSLAFLSFYVNATVRVFVPAIMPLLILYLHVSLAYAAVLVTAYWIGYTIMQIPSGVIADRFTSSRVNKVSFLLMSAVFGLFYFSMHSFVEILAIQFVLGCLSALVYISDVSLIQTWFTRKERTISVGVYQTAFFVGASLGVFITINLATVNLRLPVAAVTVMLFILAAFNIIFMSDPEHITNSTKRRMKVSVSRGIAYVGLIRFSASFVYLGFLALFTTYLVSTGEVSYSGSASYSIFVALGGIVGAPLGGIVTDRLSQSKIIPALLSSTLLGILIIAVALAHQFILILGIAISMGFLYGFYGSPSLSMATELSRRDEDIGSTSGFLNFSAQVGGAISPVIIGFLAESTGDFSTSFIIIGVIALFSLAPLYLLVARKNEDTIVVRSWED